MALKEIIEEIDEDGSGLLEFGEFCQLAAKFLVEEDEEMRKIMEKLIDVPEYWTHELEEDVTTSDSELLEYHDLSQKPDSIKNNEIYWSEQNEEMHKNSFDSETVELGEACPMSQAMYCALTIDEICDMINLDFD